MLTTFFVFVAAVDQFAVDGDAVSLVEDTHHMFGSLAPGSYFHPVGSLLTDTVGVFKEFSIWRVIIDFWLQYFYFGA